MSQPVSMGDLVVKRLEASQRLQQNPADIEAQKLLAYVEHQVPLTSTCTLWYSKFLCGMYVQASVWAGAQIKPGQYTGKKQLNALTKEDHKTGIQAWVRKVHTCT